MPSMNTKARTFENWFDMAYPRGRVNRAKAATEPEMSATTISSGFDGRGYLNFGSTGTPPVDSECRMVLRKSSGPLRPWRRLRARRAASLRGSGDSALFRDCLSSRRGGHELDVLGQRLAQRLGHRLGAPIGDQAPSDLGLDLGLELLDAVLVLLALEA